MTLSCLGAPLVNDPHVQDIAKHHDVSPATILISYHVNKGVAVLPKSTSEQRIKSNFQVISLPKEELEVLDGLAAEGRAKRINTPLFGWDLGFEDWYAQSSQNF